MITKRTLQAKKNNGENISMLTCYDFQTAQMLSQTSLDMILVGDSVGNVILGYDTTVEVSLDEMIIFGKAVTKGAPNKFVVLDLPFGTYATFENGIQNAIKLFQKTKAQAVKLEGANPLNYEIIERLTQSGVPVVGHIGLMPQSVHQQGGYYKHGKYEEDKKRLLKEAMELEKAGCFSVVLECVEENLASEITQTLSIPTIGIGSGKKTDGQVLVLNDLLGMTEKKPSFVTPIMDLFTMKKNSIEKYLHS